MAIVNTIQRGVVETLAQNVVRGMPIRLCNGFVSPETAALEVCIDPDFGGNEVALSPSPDGYFITAAPFIRCTDVAGCTVILKTQ